MRITNKALLALIAVMLIISIANIYSVIAGYDVPVGNQVSGAQIGVGVISTHEPPLITGAEVAQEIEEIDDGSEEV